MTAQTTEALRADTATPAGSQGQTAYWGGILAMTLCVFALIASEFMPVSLLTPMANDLRVSEGLAGYGIAISGAFAVLTSLSISSLAGAMNRKTLMLLMTISGLVIALAPNYEIYMVGRALIGVVVGGFWSMSVAVAIRLVPTDKVPKALAIFNGGNALATVVAAPLGSYLGGIIGWRGAFFCLVPVALIALVWQWISLPSMPTEPRSKQSGSVFSLFKNPVITLGMLAVGAFFMGQFELFTFVRPFLETVTRVDVPTLSTMLLVLGAAGLVGTMLVGKFIAFGLYRTLVIIPLIMAVIALALITFGHSIPVVFLLLGLWGLVATAAPVGWWSWIAKTAPENAEAGGGLMVAVIQLSIALGSTLGGVLFDGMGYQATFTASAALLAVAAILALLTGRAQRAR